MTPAKLARLRNELESLRKRTASIRPRELTAIATAWVGKRGKEPTFESGRPGFYPLSIPDHSGNLKKGTACNILNFLENEIARLEGGVEVEGSDDSGTLEEQED